MKRVAIYVYHDEFKLVKDYAVYFVKSLFEVADKVVIVINGDIEKKELEKFKLNNVQIIQRKNKGYDSFAYREGYLTIKDELKNYDELIFCNSSTFGPIFSFWDMFNTMSKKGIDFWGVTVHPAEPNYRVIKYNPKTEVKRHLQSYFLVFRKKMFLSEPFFEYFSSMKKINNKKEAIAFFEIQLSEHFKNLGFKYEPYIEHFDFGPSNKSQYAPDILLEKYRCPLIKKTTFGYRYDLAQKESLGEGTKRAFDFIKKTDYNVKFITDEITKSYSMDEIASFLKLQFILKENKELWENFGIITNVSGTEKFEEFKDCATVYKMPEKIGQLKEIASKHKYLLFFMPDKNLLNTLDELTKITYLKHQLENTIKSKEYAANVFEIFEKNPEIGFLTPINFAFSNFCFTKDIYKKEDVEKFEKKYNVKVKFNIKYLDTISGCFFIKSEVLNLIKEDVKFDTKKLNLGIIFLLLAQKYGFLTGRISNTESVACYTINLEYEKFNQKTFFERLKRKIKSLIT